MKQRFYIVNLFIIIFSIIVSCQTTGNLVYGTNKSKTYNSVEEYISQNFDNKKIDSKKVYFLKEEKFAQMAKEIMNDKLSMYYGISDKYFVSGNQMTIKSCSGQFQNLYKKVGNDDSDLQKLPLNQNQILSSLNIDMNRKTAIFIYSYKMGSIANSNVFEIIEHLKNEENFDYRIISLDNFDIKS